MPTTYPSPFARNPNWRAKFGVTVLNDGGGFNGARLLTNGITSIGAIVGLVSDQLGTVDVTLAITTATCSRAIGPLVGYPSKSKFVILLLFNKTRTLVDKAPIYSFVRYLLCVDQDCTDRVTLPRCLLFAHRWRVSLECLISFI